MQSLGCFREYAHRLVGTWLLDVKGEMRNRVSNAAGTGKERKTTLKRKQPLQKPDQKPDYKLLSSSICYREEKFLKINMGNSVQAAPHGSPEDDTVPAQWSYRSRPPLVCFYRPCQGQLIAEIGSRIISASDDAKIILGLTQDHSTRARSESNRLGRLQFCQFSITHPSKMIP